METIHERVIEVEDVEFVMVPFDRVVEVVRERIVTVPGRAPPFYPCILACLLAGVQHCHCHVEQEGVGIPSFGCTLTSTRSKRWYQSAKLSCVFSQLLKDFKRD